MNSKQHQSDDKEAIRRDDPLGDADCAPDRAGLPGMPAGLAALMQRAGSGRSLPPVDLWEPDFCGDLDMRIASDGTWFYMGTPIGREALVKLFASVLRKDADGRTYLVTPVEKVGIWVDDAPFLAVEMAREGEEADAAQGEAGRLIFRTNLGDLAPLDGDHPLRFELDAKTHGLKAYITVRGRLEALVTRALMYDLVAQAEEGCGEYAGLYGIRSGAHFFPVCSMDEIAMLEGME